MINNMKFAKYYASLEAAEKRKLAEEFRKAGCKNCSVVYLSHLATGYRNAGRNYLLNVERITGGLVKPHEI